MNIYFTSEPAKKLEGLIANIRNFYVLDILDFIFKMRIKPNNKANIYYINEQIVENILQASRLKKYQGIIYINKNITEMLYNHFKKKFGNVQTIDKFVLIDNGNASKHRDLFPVFEEVFFYERFKKNRIVEYTATVKGPDTRMLERTDDPDMI